MTELIIALVVVTIFLFAMAVNIYRDIVKKSRAVTRSWSEVVVQTEAKSGLISQLKGLVSDYRLHESFIHQQLDALKTSLQQLKADKPDGAQLALTEAQTRNLLKDFNIAVDSYPELKSSPEFLQAMSRIERQQEIVQAALHNFNHSVCAFNETIDIFPNCLINEHLTKKSKIKIAVDPEARGHLAYLSRLL